MLRFTFWNSGLALYLSNSRSQSSSVRGYFSPKNLHSVMLSPLRVSRVTPPSTTIEYTHAEHPASHTPSAVDCAAVILRAIGLTRPAAAAAEEATTFFAADAVCAPRKAAPADPGAMVTVLLLLLLLQVAFIVWRVWKQRGPSMWRTLLVAAAAASCDDDTNVCKMWPIVVYVICMRRRTHDVSSSSSSPTSTNTPGLLRRPC
mmetsp:Transcript_8683/g.23292  ORF Transcript_8683/g.23292 Transcript_8683/m.23292 type:complete len:203 (-) Transcript_8683:159-767(-)